MVGVYRSPEPFFHLDEIQRAITALSTARSIIIFAGAGVTIDSTGLPWSGLVRRILNEEPRLRSSITPEEAALLAAHLSPLEIATIASQYYRGLHAEAKDAQDDLDTKIKTLLYPGNEWRAGRLATNVMKLAVSFATNGRRVEIVTTNYDTHLERAYDKLSDGAVAVEANYKDSQAIPRLSIHSLEERASQLLADGRRRRALPSNLIHLTYLHGRLDPHEQRGGQLGFSEHDYAELRPHVTAVLQKILEPSDTALLVLGSSLTDPPLLSALFDTRLDDEDERENQSNRVAIMPYLSFLREDTRPEGVAKIERHIKARANEFGVKLLMPDCLYHTAQFCEEIITAIDWQENKSSTVVARYEETPLMRYGARLQGWWAAWSAEVLRGGQIVVDNADLTWQILSTALEQILDTLPTSQRVRGERFKLEMWVRWDPAGRDRELALWANSNGPRYDYDSIHTAPIGLGSQYQAVSAWADGQPRLSCPEEGGPAGYAFSRWRTFVSVPITTLSGGGEIPVGVITLASSNLLSNSGLRLNAKQTAILIGLLGEIGEWLLLDPTVDFR